MGLLTSSSDNNANITNYTKVEQPRGNGAIQNLINCLKIERLECGGLTIHGIMVAAYCNIILIIMGCFVLGCGILLTAIAWRPQEYGEEWGYWRTRIAESKKTRIAGPSLMGVGALMLAIGLALCIISHKVNKGLKTVHMREVNRAISFNYDRGGDGNTPFKPLREDAGDGIERRDSEAMEEGFREKEKKPSIAAFPEDIAAEFSISHENRGKMEEKKHQPEFYLEGSKLHVEAIMGNLSSQGAEHITIDAIPGRHTLVQQHSVDIASFPKKYDYKNSSMLPSGFGEDISSSQKSLVEGVASEELTPVYIESKQECETRHNPKS